ncbi:MAG: PAS domain S-box protein [Deltaproteobacteria bacterium]
MPTNQHDAETLRTILDGVLDAIITIDSTGRVLSFNRTAEGMFGYTAEEVIGENVSVLMTDEHAGHHDGYLANYHATGIRKIIGIGREVTARRKDGTTFEVDLGVTEHVEGGERMYFGILRDITERRHLEAQLRQSQKLEAIGTLAAGVAHDFNNILMGIRGCLKFAAAKIEDASPAQVFLTEASSAAERGANLTRQLLDFSRRTPSERERFPLNVVVAGADRLLERVMSNDVELETRLEADNDSVFGDPNQLEQVIVNLVVNARDAIEGAGKISVRTTNVVSSLPPLRNPTPCIRLSVSDTGAGMDEATQDHIFEPFFTTKPPDRGTGLGLSTVYGIVEEHGGAIFVASEVGVGTRFDIDLPIVEDD